MRLQSNVQPTIQAPKYGSVNIEQLFELSIETANKGYKLKASEIAREALIFAKQQNDYTAVYIHGFLAVLSLDFKRTSHAKIHIFNALNRLDKKHLSYESDEAYLQALLRKTHRSEELSLQVREPIAA